MNEKPEFDEELVLDVNSKPIDLSYFWSEGCAAFAVHLARELRAQGKDADIAIVSDNSGEPFSEEFPFEFSHAVVSTSNGYIDVNGFERSVDEVVQKIFDFDWSLEGDWDVEFFDKSFVGSDGEKPLYGADAEISMWIDCILKSNPEKYSLTNLMKKPKP